MLYVLSNSYSPFNNLATEEFLLKHKTEDYFLLWRSEPAVIIGKHQNLPAEINYQYIRENDIKVARRLTGGGTVVHDMQNLNFSFIVNGIPGKLIDFRKHVSPVLEFLKSIGVPATIGEKNDIRIQDLKISGNAEHVYKNRVLHHGTLLFNSDLKRLRNAIDVVPGKYLDKAVQSNRASVVNIADFLKEPMAIEAFSESLKDFVLHENGLKSEAHFSDNEIEFIEKLANDRYARSEWIWGYSPRYTFRNSFEFNGQTWKVMLEVDKGMIQHAEILIDGVHDPVMSGNFVDLLHRFEEISGEVEDKINFVDNSQLRELVYNFF